MRDLFAKTILVMSIAPPQPTPTEVAATIRNVGGFTLQVITPDTAAAVLGAIPR